MDFDCLGDYYYNRSLEFADNHYMTEAVESLQKAGQFKNSVKSLNLLGLCLYQLGRFHEAKQAWEKSISIDNSHDNEASSLIAHFEEKEFGELCEVFNKAVEYASCENFKKAVKFLESKNINRYPYADFRNLYGLCLYGAGFKTDAIKAWKNVLVIDENNPDACGYLSKVRDDDITGLFERLRRIFK